MRIRIDHYHFFEPPDLLEKIGAIVGEAFDRLNSKVDQINTVLDTHFAAEKAQVAALQQQIEDLKTQLASGGMSAEEEAKIEQRIDELTTKVAVLNPNDPAVL